MLIMFIGLIALCCKSTQEEQLLIKQKSVLNEPRLLSFNYTECKGEPLKYLYRRQHRIIEHRIEGNTSHFTIEKVNNCCGAVYPTLNVLKNKIFLYFDEGGEGYKRTDTIYKNDGTVELVKELVQPICECDCLFQISFSIENFDIENYELEINSEKYLPFQPKYQIVQSETFELNQDDTINLTDIYGFKQGRHMTYNKENRIISDGFFKSDTFTGFVGRTYDTAGRIIKERIFKNGEPYSWKYYENGKIKKECLIENYFDATDICNEYNEEGKLISKKIHE